MRYRVQIPRVSPEVANKFGILLSTQDVYAVSHSTAGDSVSAHVQGRGKFLESCTCAGILWLPALYEAENDDYSTLSLMLHCVKPSKSCRQDAFNLPFLPYRPYVSGLDPSNDRIY